MTARKFIISSLSVVLLIGCTTPKVVSHEQNTFERVRTDTLTIRDSVLIEKELIIREADSTILASYGIYPTEYPKSWLIQDKQKLRKSHDEKESVIDTVYIDRIVYDTKIEEVETRSTEIYKSLTVTLAMLLTLFVLYSYGNNRKRTAE